MAPVCRLHWYGSVTGECGCRPNGDLEQLRPWLPSATHGWIAGLSMPAGAPIGLRVGCGPTACLFIAAAAAAYPATASASLAAGAAVRG